MSARPFADAVAEYALAGWPCILPVPLKKSPPPEGFTGAEGRDTTPEDLVGWIATHAGHSIALRMPDGVIGIDVDAYAKGQIVKHGDRTLTELEERLGRLPATWSSTARGQDSPSRIRFFRVPVQRYVTRFPDIEIIQRHHRYAVVWPSPHPEAADIYRWYGPDGQVSEQPPKPDELPELTEAWIAALTEGATEAGPAAAAAELGQALLDQLVADDRPACAEITSAALLAVDELATADAGSRHDTAIARTHQLVQLAAAGHPGLAAVLPTLTDKWAELTAGEGRDDEWMRMLLTSARKAVTAVGPRQIANDPCLLIGAFNVPAPGPADDRPEDPEHPNEPLPEPLGAAHVVHPLAFIGPHLFDPRGSLDQPLAESVLERVGPAYRYAYDSGGWLLRGDVKWEALPADQAEGIVSLLAVLMPRGNPDAEKGSEPREQADRRRKFMSGGTSSGISKKIRAAVAGGFHPCSLKVTDLDREPWLLWAGGMPYDLRGCAVGPTFAQIDPATPHLHSAGVAPELRPTPLWDAFTAAVWPDPELRAWALRVLSIAFTGYADRAMPILIGDQGRGKTQVIALLMSVLGSYAHAADPRLLGGADKAHASIVYALMGRRLSFIDEGPRDSRAGKESLKQLTGGGDLTGNQMNRNPVTFTPTHTLVLTSNDEPHLVDPAVRNRVRLIPCEGDPDEVRHTRAAIGYTGAAAWRLEAPGVLAAMMRDAAAWLADPDSALTGSAPEAYRYRAEEIAADQDTLTSWLEEAVSPDELGERATVLYANFQQHCLDRGADRRSIPTITRWGRELTRRGYPAIHSKQGKRRPLRIRTIGGWPTPEPVTGWAFGDGLVTGSQPNPSPAKTPVNPGLQPPKTTHGDGLTGSEIFLTRARAHTRTHEPPVPNGGQPVNQSPAKPDQANLPNTPEPESVKITRALLEPSEPAMLDAEAEPTASWSPAQRRALEYHELKQQQQLRVEAATRGALTDRRGRDSEEVRHYFGEGEFDGQGTEPRLTWRLFLEQRRPEREREKQISSAWAAGARLGRKHAANPTPDADAEYERAAKRHDVDAFDEGYTAGITEYTTTVAEAGGELLELPALVTRDGTITPIELGAVTEIAAAFRFADELTVDVETTGYPLRHADYQLRTIQLGNDQAAIVLDAGDPDQQIAAYWLLKRAAILHAHSATADLVPLADAGVIGDFEDAFARMRDTVIPALLADPASTGSDAGGLKQLAAAVLGDNAVSPAADTARAALFKAGKWLTDVKATTPAARSGWAQVEPRCTTMIRYAASDVLDTAALAKALPPADPAVAAREHAVQQMTARVTHRGLAIDGDHVTTLYERHFAGRAQVAEQIRTAHGVDNPGSDQQIAAKLLELGAQLPVTATGRPSVARGVIDPLRAVDGPVGDLARAVLDYRHHDTLIGTFLDPYRQLTERGDGRARPTVYTLGTDTGRMSCVRPNLQQVPREGGIRACLTADPGQLLVSADFAGVELRVATALSGDENLRRLIAEEDAGHGDGVHWAIARLAFGPDATKADRYAVKRGVFGRIYGGGIPAIARGVGVSETVAAAIVDALDAMLPGLTAWSWSIRDAVKNGYTQFPSYSGRTIHLPPAYPHKAPNYLIQGSARELLVDALIRLRDTRWGDATLLPVHDEILLAVPEQEADDALAALVGCMETELHGIPIKAEATQPSYAWKDSV